MAEIETTVDRLPEVEGELSPGDLLVVRVPDDWDETQIGRLSVRLISRTQELGIRHIVSNDESVIRAAIAQQGPTFLDE
jgi:hypothetical protein